MNKEEILKKSQQENKGKYDEYEIAALGKASQIGMIVGMIICVALVIVSDIIFNTPELAFAAFIIYFAMQGSSNLVLYKYLKTREKLIFGVIEIVSTVVFTVALVFKLVV